MIGGSVNRSLEDEDGLTFGHVLDAALNQLDDDDYSVYFDGEEYGKHDEVTLAEVLQRLEKKHGRRALISGETWIKFDGVVVPTAVEWSVME